MRKPMFIYVLCLALLLTIGIRYQTTINAAITNPEVKPYNNIHIASLVNWQLDRLQAVQPSVLPVHATGVKMAVPAGQMKANAEAAALNTGTAGAKTETADLKTGTAAAKTETAELKAETPSVSTYEVTAYYLNVRANSNASSKIKGVVEKGTKLTVERVMDNGWLKLEGGEGYVHGGYAKQLGKEAAPAFADAGSDVHILSFEAGKPAVREAIALPQPKPAAEPSKPTSAVESESGLTEAHIAELFEGTALADHDLEKAILEVEKEYGINAYFTIAVMKLESGNGKSKLARNKNNLFGLNAGGGGHKASSFETKGDSVRRFGQLLSEHYVDKGYTTIEKVARKYCPPNPKWSSLVLSIMKRDYKKL